MLIFYAFKRLYIDTEKPDGMCSPAFYVDEILGLFLDPSIFSITDSRAA